MLAQFNDQSDEMRCPFVIVLPEADDADPIEARMVMPPCLSAAIWAMFWIAILDERPRTCQAARAGASAKGQPSTPPMSRPSASDTVAVKVAAVEEPRPKRHVGQ